MIQGIKPWARPATVALIVSFTAALISVASSASALEFYVDGGTGDDARSALEAQTQTTPWATISHALSTVDTTGGRHTIRVQSGTYSENPASAFANVELRALGGPVTITAGGGSPGIDISHADILIEGITIEGGTHGIRAATADGLVIRGSTSVGATSNGFHIETTAGVTIENSRAISAGGRGILLKKSSLAYVRNNLAYENGEWGIDIENTDTPLPPTSTGNVIAFNTVAYNGLASGGGVRLRNATAYVYDSIITHNLGIGLFFDTAGANVQNILLFGNTTRLSPSSYALGGGMLAISPMYVDPNGSDGTRGGIANYADDVFALDPSSPAVDAGSGLVAERDIDGSTRQDLAPDSGTADMGFHEGASAGAGPPAVPTGPATYYVNGATGSDANDRIAAQDPNTPWATISHALASGLLDDETIVVAAGTYAESIATTVDDTTILTTAGAILEIPFDDIGITISHSGTTIDGFTIDGATNGAKHGIEITGASDTTIQDVLIDTPTEVGVKASTSGTLLLQDVTVTAPGTRGVELTTCAAATIRGLVVTGGQH
ncbi:MAG: right-handed parallel beta-helix repeat-containing protein, partial [Candidatus Binatia bacterium]|nr:right-handed parallel beta-helix repeat-containing protein [Candidatus Binatia bacterium]